MSSDHTLCSAKAASEWSEELGFLKILLEEDLMGIDLQTWGLNRKVLGGLS